MEGKDGDQEAMELQNSDFSEEKSEMDKESEKNSEVEEKEVKKMEESEDIYVNFIIIKGILRILKK
jgi:hypothetical protein